MGHKEDRLALPAQFGDFGYTLLLEGLVANGKDLINQEFYNESITCLFAWNVKTMAMIFGVTVGEYLDIMDQMEMGAETTSDDDDDEDEDEEDEEGYVPPKDREDLLNDPLIKG